ncbi:unnamed protein product [Leuciscus chuanchicus]
MFKLMESHTFLQQCLHLPIGCCGLSSVTVFECSNDPPMDSSGLLVRVESRRIAVVPPDRSGSSGDGGMMVMEDELGELQ